MKKKLKDFYGMIEESACQPRVLQGSHARVGLGVRHRETIDEPEEDPRALPS